MSKLNIQLHAWQPGRIPANVIVSADALPTHMTFSFLGTHSLEASALIQENSLLHWCPCLVQIELLYSILECVYALRFITFPVPRFIVSYNSFRYRAANWIITVLKIMHKPSFDIQKLPKCIFSLNVCPQLFVKTTALQVCEVPTVPANGNGIALTYCEK